MDKFKKKNISRGQTLSDKLRNARNEKSISLSEASKATKIQEKYLKSLETSDYQALPGDVYAKIWLKIYADFLGIDSRAIVSEYRIEKIISDRIQKSRDRVNPQSIVQDSFFLRPRNIKIAAIVIILLIMLSYFIWELSKIVRAPEINILYPAGNISTTDNTITIKGKTEIEAELRLNEVVVLLDEKGNFEQVINLVIGLNKLEISAKKKHSRTREIELNILRELIN